MTIEDMTIFCSTVGIYMDMQDLQDCCSAEEIGPQISQNGTDLKKRKICHEYTHASRKASQGRRMNTNKTVSGNGVQ